MKLFRMEREREREELTDLTAPLHMTFYIFHQSQPPGLEGVNDAVNNRSHTCSYPRNNLTPINSLLHVFIDHRKIKGCTVITFRVFSDSFYPSSPHGRIVFPSTDPNIPSSYSYLHERNSTYYSLD